MISVQLADGFPLTIHRSVLLQCSKLARLLDPSTESIDFRRFSCTAGHALVQYLYSKEHRLLKWTGPVDPSLDIGLWKLKLKFEIYTLARTVGLDGLDEQVRNDIEWVARDLEVCTVVEAVQAAYPVPIGDDTWFPRWIRSLVKQTFQDPRKLSNAVAPSESNNGTSVVKLLFECMLETYTDMLESLRVGGRDGASQNITAAEPDTPVTGSDWSEIMTSRADRGVDDPYGVGSMPVSDHEGYQELLGTQNHEPLVEAGPVPKQEPEPEAEPAPEIATGPKPEPEVESAPEPEPEPEEKPAPEPGPGPIPDPGLEPTPKPIPQLEAEIGLASEPEPQAPKRKKKVKKVLNRWAESEPVLEPQPEPKPEPQPEPQLEPEPESEPEPEPQMPKKKKKKSRKVFEPDLEPEEEPAPEPASEAEAEAEPDPQGLRWKNWLQRMAEPKPEYDALLEAEPVPTVETEPEPVPEPTPEPEVEAEPVPEPPQEPALKSLPRPEVESPARAVDEPPVLRSPVTRPLPLVKKKKGKKIKVRINVVVTLGWRT